ncbi:MULTISPECIES: hypothetical protein [Streptomyces]|uniref:hypothetical protein n=1 Tax=Streptomyces TaxID=1883 RepID=UPI000C14F613|nr:MULTISPECIES: hypothetical protein [Streptomyces]PIB11872.1 hypothetical protein B1C81_01200 [Streptomyces sp. HG99]
MDDKTTVTRDDRRLTCGRCGHRAHAGTLTGGHAVKQVFRHTEGEATAGHEVEPVWGEVFHRCDFCDPEIEAVWSYQVLPVETRVGLIAGLRPAEVFSSRGLNDTPWYACPACADLIQAKQWRELLKRSLSLYEKRTGHRPTTGLRIQTHETHQQFVQMMTGHRLPLDGAR